MKYYLPIALAAVSAWAQTPPKPAAQQPVVKVNLDAPPPAPEPGPNDVVLTIGSEKLTKSEWTALIDALPEQAKAQAASPEGRRRLAEQLAEIKALAQAARKEKFDQDARQKAILQIQLDQTLASNYLRNLIDKAPADDAVLKELYEKEKDLHQQVNARHILVRFKGSPVPVRTGKPDMTEDEAKARALELKKRLEAGEKFDELARAESDDSGSGAQGGELGVFGRGQMVREFEEAAFALPVAKVSDPVRSQFGFHLIQVNARVDKSFDEVKPALEQRRKPELQRKLSDQVKKSTNIVLDEGYFGKAVAPAPGQ